MLFKVYLLGVCIHAANSLFHIESLRIRGSMTRDRSGKVTISKEMAYYVKNVPWSILWPIDLLKRGWELFNTEF